MRPQWQPGQLLFVILAGRGNRQQRDAIGYLRTEYRILREKLGKKRILLNDDQRRRLAVKGKILGRKMLEELAGNRHYGRCTAHLPGVGREETRALRTNGTAGVVTLRTVESTGGFPTMTPVEIMALLTALVVQGAERTFRANLKQLQTLQER